MTQIREYEVPMPKLQTHLQELQAVPYPDRSSTLRHVYFSQNLGLWV